MSCLGFLGNGRYVQANGLRCDVFLRFVGVLGDPGRYAQTDGLRCDVILWFMVGLFHMLKKCPFWRAAMVGPQGLVSVLHSTFLVDWYGECRHRYSD